MNLYNLMQQVEAMQQETQRKVHERQQYAIIAQPRSQIRQLRLWRVLWAWFVARRQTQNYDETVERMLCLLQPRKPKLVQTTHK